MSVIAAFVLAHLVQTVHVHLQDRKTRALEGRIGDLEAKQPPAVDQIAQRVGDRLGRGGEDASQGINRRAAAVLLNAGWSVDDVAKAFREDRAKVDDWLDAGAATSWSDRIKDVETAITGWPRLPDGAEFIPSPFDPGGVMLVLTPQGLHNLSVDRAGRLSSTGFRLRLRLPEAARGGHEG